MKKARWIFWVVAGLVVVAAGVLFSPNSPYYLPDWWVSQGHYHGQSTRFWVKALDSDDQQMRHQAIFALGAIGPEAGHAVPKLAVIMLEDEDRIARAQASLALSKMTPASESAVDALTQALEDRELVIRMNAAMTLFRLREKARPAGAALMRCMRDDSNGTNLAHFPVTIQEQMVLTLGRVCAGTDEAVPALSEALKGAGSDGMRRAAVRALGFVGTQAKPALPLIRSMLESPNNELRSEAEETIAKVERKAKPDA
jgi:HEAT repeat protein